MLLVGHDRDFLDRVVRSIIATNGNGRWVEYAGGYTDMLAQRAAESRGSPPPKPRNTKQSCLRAIVHSARRSAGRGQVRAAAAPRP